MKKILLMITLLFTGLIIGCATYVTVDVLKPAQVNIGDVKKIAVLDFEFIGSWNLDKEKEPETLIEIAGAALKKGLGVAEEAPPPLDPLTAFPGKNISDQLIRALVENGHFTILEREHLSKIMNELELSMTGIIEGNQATEIGKLLGVDAIIFGSGAYSVEDDAGWYEYTNEDEGKYYQYKIIRKVGVEITYRIVDISTGMIVASKTNSAFNYDESKLLFPYEDHVEEDDEDVARENIVNWHPIVGRLVSKIVKKTVKQVAPHYEEEDMLILTGETSEMKAGFEYAKRKLWEDAKSSWESVLEKTSKSALDDHVHAKYNLGVYHEIHGNLNKAEELFNQCFKESNDSSYLDDRARIQKRKEELEKLREQQD